MPEFFFIALLIAVLALSIGYALNNYTVGPQAAQRRLGITALLILLGLGIGLGLHSLGKYASVGFNFLFAACVGFWLLSWNWRKKTAGVLILNPGRMSVNKLMLCISVFQILLALFNTWSAIQRISKGLESDTNLVEVLSQLLFFWSLAIYFLSLGLSRPEFRENGICYNFSVVKWDKLESYWWNEDTPNVVTISLKQPRFPLFKRLWSLPIPSKHQQTVNRILVEHMMIAR